MAARDWKAVRSWARDNGYEVGNVGILKKAIVDSLRPGGGRVMMQTFGDWLVDQQLDQPDCAAVDDLIEVKAVSLYRVLYLMERGGKREDLQAAASLRHWVGLA